MLEKFIKRKSSSDDIEYLQYAQGSGAELEQTGSWFAQHGRSPEEIIKNMLITATLFYDGDGAGVMGADLTMKIWSTQWWNNRRTNGMTLNRLADWEEGDCLWLWPDEDDERANTNVKVLVYLLQQIFGLISDYRLIESTRTGYRINPELNVITDLKIFEEYWNQVQITADPSAKGNLLKKPSSFVHGALASTTVLNFDQLLIENLI